VQAALKVFGEHWAGPDLLYTCNDVLLFPRHQHQQHELECLGCSWQQFQLQSKPVQYPKSC